MSKKQKLQKIYESMNRVAISELKETGVTNRGTFALVLEEWSNDGLLELAMFLSEEVQKRIDKE